MYFRSLISECKENPNIRCGPLSSHQKIENIKKSPGGSINVLQLYGAKFVISMHVSTGVPYQVSSLSLGGGDGVVQKRVGGSYFHHLVI